MWNGYIRFPSFRTNKNQNSKRIYPFSLIWDQRKQKMWNGCIHFRYLGPQKTKNVKRIYSFPVIWDHQIPKIWNGYIRFSSFGTSKNKNVKRIYAFPVIWEQQKTNGFIWSKMDHEIWEDGYIRYFHVFCYQREWTPVVLQTTYGVLRLQNTGF